MARRNLLHKSKLQGFKEWLTDNGVEWRDGKGGYQVIQIRTIRGWSAIYDSDKERREHYTVQDDIKPLVSKFVYGRKL
ncbi:hypothetical protein [Serratia nevei]|uniref:hypothetical protein n=1 Tax=Serratia nevei TaxID=2703794 RepID=UPI00313AD352